VKSYLYIAPDYLIDGEGPKEVRDEDLIGENSYVFRCGGRSDAFAAFSASHLYSSQPESADAAGKITN